MFLTPDDFLPLPLDFLLDFLFDFAFCFFATAFFAAAAALAFLTTSAAFFFFAAAAEDLLFFDEDDEPCFQCGRVPFFALETSSKRLGDWSMSTMAAREWCLVNLVDEAFF